MYKNNAIIKYIYFLYVFFLPLGSFIAMPEVISGALNLFKSMSTNIMLVGVIYIIIVKKRITLSKSVLSFWHLYIFMLVYSLLAAFLILILNNPTERNPFDAILGDASLYLEVVLSVFFNWYCLSNIVKFNELYSILAYQIIFSISFGLLQMMAVLGHAPFSSIYTGMTTYLSLFPLEKLILMERGLTLFGSEPSALTQYNFIAIPFLLSNIVYKRYRKLSLLGLSLFVILFIASNSSQNLISFIIVLFSFIVYLFFKRLKSHFLILAFTMGMIFAVSLCIDIKKVQDASSSFDENAKIEYLILGKAANRDNMSVAMRASGVINSLKCFYNHFGLGVGDGCQGYYYAKNVPEWCKESDEVQETIQNHKITNGGGSFFASFLSGYGIFGIIAMLFFLKSYINSYKSSILFIDERINMIFYIAVVVFLFSGWYTIGIKQNESFLFILSLPMVSCYRCHQK